MIRITTLLCASLWLAAAAGAAETERYELEQSGDAWIRMDKQTGEMSRCEERGGQLVCRLAADERAAFEADMDRLNERVAGLEARIATLENSLSQRLERSLPTEEEFEKSLGYMERFLRGFMDIVRDMEEGKPAPAPEQPDGSRT